VFYFAKWSDASRDIAIMSDAIAYRSPTVQWLALYKRLTGFHEFPWGFHLYFDDQHLHLIPKAHFSPEEIAHFRKLISPQS